MQKLKALVIGMGLLIVAATAAIVVALVGRGSEKVLGDPEQETAAPAPAGFGDSEVALPDGCRIAEMLAEGERLLLRLDGPAARGCAQIVVVDLDSGAVRGRLRIRPEGTAAAAE